MKFPYNEISFTGKFPLWYIVFIKQITVRLTGRKGGRSMNAATLSALAEPNRVNIVELLRDVGALTLGEIAERLGLRLPQSSKHLRVLTDAGLVVVEAVANRRIFKVRKERFAELDRWAQSFLDAKEEQFSRLDALLSKVQEQQNEPK
jgi:DNA-binding transcriptional ArsR family regulator